ncbi:MAG: aminotransferase class IV [Micavibrio sp.]|nr:aminotransferase class IV [Micavibrio sp.]
MTQIFLNGEFIDDERAFSFNDRIRLGDGVFDTMLVIIEGTHPRLIYARAHFDRLINSLNVMEIPFPHPFDICEAEALTLIRKNAPPNGRYALNTVITRGVAARGLMPPLPEDTKPTIAMKLSPVPDSFPEINAIISRRAVRNEHSPLSHIKSLDYGDNILALIEARHKGANEALIPNTQGHISCATAGNIFTQIDGLLYTPPLADGAMDGITRKMLMEKYDVIESSLELKDLLGCEGLYITNSIKGCMAVSTLNGRPLPAPTLEIPQDFQLA